MAAASLTLLVVLAGLVAPTAAGANPIRKVVTMLQDMQKSVEEEGKKEEDLFDKFMCYCSNGEGALEASIQQGKAQIEQLATTVDRTIAEKSQLDQAIVSHKADREEAEKVIKESTALREKEAAEVAASSGDMKSNIASMTAALEALKKGLSASLLQTGVGSFIRNVVRTSPAVQEGERPLLMSFLESGTGLEGGSDQIIGIVEQMKETMEADLAESESKEATAKTDFETLMTSKTSEIAAAGKAVETKTARSGQAAVETVQAKADKESTEKAVAEDIEFKANLAKNCASKQKEWDERCKLRAQEIEAISETIKLLNSDDALELFKKTIPSAAAAASFVQTSATTRSRSRMQMRTQMRRAKDLIQGAMSSDKAHSVKKHLMLLALKSGMGGFEKVVGMVDGMVGVLEEEQVQDDKQDVWCLDELDKAAEEIKATETDLEEVRAAIDEGRDAVAGVASEIEAIKAGLVELDKSVAEATEQRKKEHQEYIDSAAMNQATVELIGMAKNRMNKFYNPTLYKEPEKTDEEDFFAQVAVRRAAPGPPPEMPSGEYKKSESSSGVIALMDDMINDVEDDMSEGKRDEEEAQKDYEEEMNDAATKRSDDSKLIVTKDGEKAEKTTKLEENKELKRTKASQLDVMEAKQDNLHKTCDFLLAEYAKLKEERTNEEEGLKASKQVLSGAKVFLQGR
jgi:hypothetical protein